MIVVEQLQKSYQDASGRAVSALHDVSLTVEEGEFYVLLGPSGSGKTTTLRAIAGLEHPDTGLIEMAGEAVFSSDRGVCIPTERRPIAMVFQSYALWPHMSVFENIAFPLRRGLRRIPAADLRPRVERAAGLLSLQDYLGRSVSQLSGGQQQRVALARAIALEPAVLLMDEPLSNLDARLRSRLRVELKELTRALGITTVYVTHDQGEAMVMGDRIAVMEAGRMLQEGKPDQLYQQPGSLAVARFLGDMNLIDAAISGQRDGVLEVACAAGTLLVRGETASHARNVTLGFRPEDARLATAPQGHTSGLRATVKARHYLGPSQLYQLDVAGTPVQVQAPKHLIFAPGATVFIEVDPHHCMVFETTPNT